MIWRKANLTQLQLQIEHVITLCIQFLECPVRFPEKTGLPWESLDNLEKSSLHFD